MGDEVTFDSDQLTLTCISTGGPATTVTWTRDSTTTFTTGNETVLDDPETAQYTHILTVTTGGEYTCTVENNKPSSDSATIILGGLLITRRMHALLACYMVYTRELTGTKLCASISKLEMTVWDRRERCINIRYIYV